MSFKVRGRGRSFTTSVPPQEWSDTLKPGTPIVKIEWLPDGRWKVQGKGHQNLRIVSDANVPDNVRAMMGNKQTIYCKGYWMRSQGQWSIGERVEDQQW